MVKTHSRLLDKIPYNHPSRTRYRRQGIELISVWRVDQIEVRRNVLHRLGDISITELPLPVPDDVSLICMFVDGMGRLRTTTDRDHKY